MENREQQILSEITQMIATLREQLDVLEEKVSQLALQDETEVVDEAPIDLDIEEILDYPSVSEPEILEEDIPEPVEEDIPEPVEEEVAEPEVVEVFEEAVPEPEVFEVFEEAVPEPEAARPVIIDAMARKEEWRTAIPGSPLKDIRGAISLHDRIIFINGLFDEDPIFFQEVLTRINSMTSLDEAVAYLREVRPMWDMESDEVYRFMMAVRRRIQ